MFDGVYTAIITPFNQDGSIDYGCFSALLEQQEAAGVAGVVPVGTTGESPTLSFEEHCRVVDFVVEKVGAGCGKCCQDRLQVIAGTGGNSTAEALELTRHAKSSGVDATLQVTPYYNKPNQEGLYRHFMSVAELGVPVMLYNVPGRSSREIAVETIARLAEHPSIVAVKEAGGSVDRVSQILDVCEIDVLSGDDTLTLPMMAVGAKGVVSVVSNLVPRIMVAMVAAAQQGRFVEAAGIHRSSYRLFASMFIDTNPLPVKTAMSLAGMCDCVFRLPLCEMDEETIDRLRTILEGSGIL